MTRSGRSHHARVVVGLLGGADGVQLGQVAGQSLGAVDQHLLQAGQILDTQQTHNVDMTKNV